MFKSDRIAWTVLLIGALGSSDARAQNDSRLAMGLSVTSRIAGSSHASGSADVGFECGRFTIWL